MAAISTLEKQVRLVLKECVETRNSDIALTHEIWRRFYADLIQIGGLVKLSDMYRLPQQDNVKRIRARVQNDEKLYPPTEWLIAKARHWKEQEWRTHLGYPTRMVYPSPEHLPEQIVHYQTLPKSPEDEQLQQELFE